MNIVAGWKFYSIYYSHTKKIAKHANMDLFTCPQYGFSLICSLLLFFCLSLFLIVTHFFIFSSSRIFLLFFCSICFYGHVFS